jgi:hypothetical protein
MPANVSTRPETAKIEKQIIAAIKEEPRKHSTSTLVALWPRPKQYTVRRTIDRLESKGIIRSSGMNGDVWEIATHKGRAGVPTSVFDLPRVMGLVGGTR